MTIKPFLIFSLAATGLAATFGSAQAQLAPPDRADVRAQRRQALANMTRDQRAQYFQNQWQQRYNAASPEQKARMDAMRAQMNQAMQAHGLDPNNPQAIVQFMQNGGMRALRQNQNGAAPTAGALEAQMRAMMNAVAITDKATQDPVVAYVLQRRKERELVLGAARDLASALRALVAGNASATPTAAGAATPASDSTIAAKFDAYQSALEADKALEKDELAALDKAISFSTHPRVNAFLSLVGITTPDALQLGGVGAIFNAPAANRARPTNAAAQGVGRTLFCHPQGGLMQQVFPTLTVGNTFWR